MVNSNKKKEYWKTFDINWFRKNQNKILYWLNGPLLKKTISRYVFGIHTKENLVEIFPNYYKILLPNGQFQSTFRTYDIYSKKMYFAFLPIWWILHFFDWLFFDRFLPQYSFGLNTLTAYPQVGSGGGNVSCDVSLYCYGSPSSWSAVHDATTGGVLYDGGTIYAAAVQLPANTSNLYDSLYRSGYSFDTSSLTSGATVTAVTFSVFAYNKWSETSYYSPTNLHVISFSPADAGVRAAEDYDQFGTTSFAYVTFENFSSRVDFSLNASGISNINKSGVSKYGLRFKGDIDNSPPWTSASGHTVYLLYTVYSADYTASYYDPKLIVTYDAPPVTYKPTGAILVG